MTASVAKWDVFEIVLEGPRTGNPYLDVTLGAEFAQGNRRVPVPGFYDGDGLYRVRFMPDTEGPWTWVTTSTATALADKSGSLTVAPAREGVHGPVRVRNTFHFAHADGTPYFPFGTTCYAWTHQPLDQQELTLASLRKAGFNKLRMAVFPKDYPFNTNEPLQACFEKGPDGREDFDRPNPAHFRHFERQVAALMDLGIEADVILFHPYDRWGYCTMSAEQDCRYVAYMAARLSAYRNVWWSLANEYDFLLDIKPLPLWDRFFHILEEHDHVRHLKSIHNGDASMNFDHRKPWVDHVCIQNWDVKRTPEWRDAYGKPVVNDEPEYEGNIVHSWGNISARELVHRFWVTLVRGGYAGHGETYHAQGRSDLVGQGRRATRRSLAAHRVPPPADRRGCAGRPDPHRLGGRMAVEPRLGRHRRWRALHLLRRAPARDLGLGATERGRRLRDRHHRYLGHDGDAGGEGARADEPSAAPRRRDPSVHARCRVRDCAAGPSILGDQGTGAGLITCLATPRPGEALR